MNKKTKNLKLKKSFLNLVLLDGACFLQSFSMLKHQASSLNLNSDISIQKISNEKVSPVILDTVKKKDH